MRNKLYEVVYQPKQRAATISRSPYLKMLMPEEALIKLRNRRKRLIRKLEQCEQAFMDGKLERQEATQTTRELVLEMELCEHCMTCIREYDLRQLRIPRPMGTLKLAA